MPDTNGKYVKMKKFIDKINELEKTRTYQKKQLREALSNPLLSINSIVEYAVGYQKDLKQLAIRIQNLHRLYNQHWFGLTYEEKVRYRYWSNGEEFLASNLQIWNNSLRLRLIFRKIERSQSTTRSPNAATSRSIALTHRSSAAS